MFRGGIPAVDVEAGVGLGVAATLRVGEGGRDADAVLAHACQHHVGGAVDDGVDRGKVVRLVKWRERD